MTRGEQLIQVLIEAARAEWHMGSGSIGEMETREARKAREALEIYVRLLEGWYPFDPKETLS